MIKSYRQINRIIKTGEPLFGTNKLEGQLSSQNVLGLTDINFSLTTFTQAEADTVGTHPVSESS